MRHNSHDLYASSTDAQQGVAVWLSRGIPNAEDWARCLADLREVTEWGPRLGSVRPAILFVATECGRPDARRRQDLTEATASRLYNPQIAMITTNPLVRGVLTIMEWTQPEPAHETRLFSDSAAGIAWLEQGRGTPLPRLRELLAEVEREVATRSTMPLDASAVSRR